jgi:uncharacterized small protein (DUF1192 family)
MNEDEPVRRRPRFEPMPLDPLGDAELRGYIDDLRGEIARVEAEIERKAGHRAAAAAFFKTS